MRDKFWGRLGMYVDFKVAYQEALGNGIQFELLRTDKTWTDGYLDKKTFLKAAPRTQNVRTYRKVLDLVSSQWLIHGGCIPCS